MSEARLSRRRFIDVAAKTAVAVTAVSAVDAIGTPAFADTGIPNPETTSPKAERKVPIGVNLFDGAFDPNYEKRLDELEKAGITLVRVIAANKNYPMTQNSTTVHRYIEAAKPRGISVAVMFMNHYGDQGHYPKEVDFRFFSQGDETPQLDQSFYKNIDTNQFPEFVDRIVTDNKDHSNLHSWQLINEARTKKALLINFLAGINRVIRQKDKSTHVFSGILSTANTGTTAEELYGSIPNLHVNGNSYDNEKVAELLGDAYWATAKRRQMSITELGYDINDSNRTKSFIQGMDLWENTGVDSIFLWGLPSHSHKPDERYGLTIKELQKIMASYRRAA